MKTTSGTRARRGFSLVELLVVIAVIGILAAIAIPMISNINSNSTAAKNKRNAQNICSIYGAARSAGAPFTGTTKEDIVTQLAQGVSGSGAFGSNNFKLNVASGERAAALAYCTFNSSDEIMSYDPGGGAASAAPVNNNPWGPVGPVPPADVSSEINTLSHSNPNYNFRAGGTMSDGSVMIEAQRKMT